MNEVLSIATETILAPQSEVFELLTNPEHLPEIFMGYGLIPGAVRADFENGNDLQPGTVRVVENTDGSVIRERIEEHLPGLRHSYRLLSGVPAPFSWLISGFRGQWTFDASAEGLTHVTWLFTLEARAGWAMPLVALINRVFLRQAQQRSLQNLRHLAEAPYFMRTMRALVGA